MVKSSQISKKVSRPACLLDFIANSVLWALEVIPGITFGTSMLWVEGQMSSSFLPVKMSKATMWTLACPCFPVLEVDISTILQGLFLIMTWPPLRRAEHCMGRWQRLQHRHRRSHPM